MCEIELLPLHSRPEFMDECEHILNSEWPQSSVVRRRMLTQSSDTFPCSLVLLRNDATAPVVLGHSRIGRVLGQKDSFWIKSVVVRREYRGMGFGKLLMLKTEEFAKNLGYLCSYLTTYDKQGFYQRIGYEFCQPVCFIGNSSFAEKLMLKLGDQSSGLCNTTTTLVNNNNNNNNNKSIINPKVVNGMPPTLSSFPLSQPQSPPPPPPPPPPPFLSSSNPNFASQEEIGPGILMGKTWMRKNLVS